MGPLKRCLVFGLVPWVWSCGIWLDVDAPQCSSNQDCVALLGKDYTCSRSAGVCMAPRAQTMDAGPDIPDLPPEWDCLNDPPRTFTPDPDRMVRVRMDAVELASLKPPSDLKVDVCNPSDYSCSSPVRDDVMPGPDGFVELEVPHGFTGFLTFESPSTVPSVVYNNQPWLENAQTSGPALATQKSLDDIYERAGRPTNVEDVGLAILEIRNCKDGAGDGVSFDPIGEEQPFYFDGALPSREISATTSSNALAARAEERAVGGFSNLPAGIRTFTARLEGTDVVVGRYTMNIRAKQVAYLRLYPQWR